MVSLPQRTVLKLSFLAFLTSRFGVARASWFDGRDNSMRPIELTSGTPEGHIGRAMAVIMSRAGISEAVQVCEGVYLAAGHGILDSPSVAQTSNRPQRPIEEQRVRVIAYGCYLILFIERDHELQIVRVLQGSGVT